VSHLRAQTVRDRLEIVIVAPSAEELEADASEFEGFAGVRVLAVGPITSTAQARATAIRHATAPVVVFGEDHSYPDPGWAEALIAAHQGPWAAVGPVVRNANPNSTVGWADVILNSNRWLEPVEAGPVDDLQGRNSSYKRAVLLEYGAKLGALLELETILHWDLRARGYRLFLEPAARTYHQNHTRVSALALTQFHVGRLFAAARAERWSSRRRLAYAGSTALTPLVRMYRLTPRLQALTREHHLRPGFLPALTVALAAQTLGELLGYTLGAGEASRRLVALEFRNRPG
jgi:hypothetical protein